MESKYIFVTLILICIVLIFNIYYFEPAVSISKNQGTVLSDNWWEALNWIKNNTKECAVIATYWDPGHFITGIARRPVVFDGASQGAQLVIEANSTEDGIVIERYENSISRIKVFEDGQMKTARIQDIATTLLTTNETLAIEILENYKKPECDEMYYIASADLIGKSLWWTYFATWEPTGGKNCPNVGSDKGNCYNYLIANLQGQPRPVQSGIAYVYPISQQNAFLLILSNDTLNGYLQQGTQLAKIERVYYFTQQGGVMATTQDAEIKGLLWVDPSGGAVIFIPPELADSMFTRMYFFDGAGLEKFEFVENWGGEVKLFRIKFNK